MNVKDMIEPEHISMQYESTIAMQPTQKAGTKKRANIRKNAEDKGNQDDNKVVPIRRSDVSPLKVISINQLLQNEYEPVKWIIPDILPEGLTLFCAAPKIGKSMVALAIALRMARRVHGGIDGETLYLSLDDISERRLQSRTRSLLQGKEVQDRVFFATESQALDTGLIDQLEQYMFIRPATTLVIIDVYGTVKPKRVGDDIYKNDYNALNSLRTFATKHRMAVILIHHTRKRKDDDDWINNINGSNGLAGACDTLWYLKRARGSQEMKLCIDGREDGLANEVGLTLEDLDLPWVIDGMGTPQDLNQSEQLVINVLQQTAIPQAPKQIAELAKLNVAHSRKIVRRMLVKNLLIQTKYGAYALPTKSESKEGQSDRVTNNENVVTLCETNAQAGLEPRVTRVTTNSKPVTLSNPALQATLEARVTEGQEKTYYPVPLTYEPALEASSQRVTKSDNINTSCPSVTLASEDIPDEPEEVRGLFDQSVLLIPDDWQQPEIQSIPSEIELSRARKILDTCKEEGITISYIAGNDDPSYSVPDGFSEERFNKLVEQELKHHVALQQLVGVKCKRCKFVLVTDSEYCGTCCKNLEYEKEYGVSSTYRCKKQESENTVRD